MTDTDKNKLIDGQVVDLIARLEKMAKGFAHHDLLGAHALITDAVTALQSQQAQIDELQQTLAEHEVREGLLKAQIMSDNDSKLCCSGFECGCQGALVGHEIIHHIEQDSKKALTYKAKG